MKGQLSTLVLWLLFLTVQDTAGADELRLADGGSPCAGRVEVKHDDRWGTVCDDGWDMDDAGVVCNQLGCGSAVSAYSNALFGAGSGPTWLYWVSCGGDEPALWDCRHPGWGVVSCSHSEDAGVTCSAPPHGKITVPVIICIILGTLLCFVLILLGVQVRSARAQRRDSRRPLDPFLEAVYEEIDYNLMREKQEMFSRSEDSVTKLQYYTGDSEGEKDPGSQQEGASPGGSQLGYDNVEEPALNDVPQTPDDREAPDLPGDFPGDGYDDARELSDPEGDSVLGQDNKEGPRASDRNKDSQIGWCLHSLRSEGVSGMEKETPFLPHGDTGYDDVEHGDSGGSVSEQLDWTK